MKELGRGDGTDIDRGGTKSRARQDGDLEGPKVVSTTYVKAKDSMRKIMQGTQGLGYEQFDFNKQEGRQAKKKKDD